MSKRLAKLVLDTGLICTGEVMDLDDDELLSSQDNVKRMAAGECDYISVVNGDDLWVVPYQRVVAIGLVSPDSVGP